MCPIYVCARRDVFSERSLEAVAHRRPVCSVDQWAQRPCLTGHPLARSLQSTRWEVKGAPLHSLSVRQSWTLDLQMWQLLPRHTDALATMVLITVRMSVGVLHL